MRARATLWTLASLATACLQAAATPSPDADARDLGAGVGYVQVIRLAHQPRAADNGRLLRVHESATDPGIPVHESTDGGIHWRSLGVVGEQAHDKAHGGQGGWQLPYQPDIGELPRPVADLPRGALLLAANGILKDAHGRIERESLQLYASTDLGRSWHYRGTIIEGGGRPEDRLNRGVWEPDIVVLDDGRLVAHYSSEQHKREGFNQLLAYKVSADGGRSWGVEVRTVALDGGAERPGMPIVERLPTGGYAMSYENIDGERNGQVHLKLSRDGLDWGDPSDRGIAVQTADDSWPVASPIVRWFPSSDPSGVLVVAAQRGGGNDDGEGRRLYWNNDLGRGPWWQVAAPVRKRTGNIHAGWTQSLLADGDGRIAHFTSSSSPQRPRDIAGNHLLQASAALNFRRYEAENAQRTGAARIADDAMSNGARVRLAGKADARLRFDVRIDAPGARALCVRYADLGLAAVPALRVDGAAVATDAKPVAADGWRNACATIALAPGRHRIEIRGVGRALDYDWLEATPADAVAARE